MKERDKLKSNRRLEGRHIVYAFVGPLQTRGRLLKQIETATRNGALCTVLLGDTVRSFTGKDKFSFEVFRTYVNIDRNPICSFTNTIAFCRSASRVLCSLKPEAVVLLGLGALSISRFIDKVSRDFNVIFDNNELQLESIDSPVKRNIWKLFHNSSVKRCDAIIHAERNRKNYFLKKYPGKDKPQFVIENFPFYRDVKVKADWVGRVRMIYLGAFAHDRQIDEVVGAVAALGDIACLDIVGFGKESFVNGIRDLIQRFGASNIRVLPGIPYSQVGKMLEEYDVGLAFYKNTNLNNYYCAPNKVYDYLMTGLPIITNSYPGLVDVVEKNRVGVCIDRITSDSMRIAINEIKNGRMWLNIDQELKMKYSWEAQEERYIRILEQFSAR